ncbi:MAG: uracil-DNA glycosylase family protein [Clostridium sp.]|nr:uracil-DNA glycosylase family protein [Clostridium sp.]
MTPTPKDNESFLERHPFGAFVPEGARVLIMGTFPPQPKRWAMEFFYPNRTNDFWKIMGLIFYGDQFRFYNPKTKAYDEASIRRFLAGKHIALSDTGAAVRRLRDNASDKFLEIVEPVDLGALLARMPDCTTIATTGEKAAGVVASLTGSEPPRLGQSVAIDWNGRRLLHWRMPSTSRAYPLPIEQKADFYRRIFVSAPTPSR